MESTNKFLNEAFENSQGTQRSDLGLWKKFALNLITTAVPNLIATDLVITYPMSSMSGYVNYVQYTTGSNKGAYTNDPADVLNDPFHLGSFKKDANGKLDINYTSSKVVEAKTAVSAAKKVEGSLNWLPVIPGTVEFVVGSTTYVDDGNGKIKIKDSTEVAGSSIDYKTGKYSFDTTENASTAVFANYVYDNVVIPQNDLPIVNAQIKAIPLIAKARRVAIYFSQIAA